MPSLFSDITFIDLPNVVSLVTGREGLKPDLTNGKKIYLCSSEFKSHLKCVFSLYGRTLHLFCSPYACRSVQCLINFLNVLPSQLDQQRIFGFGTEGTKSGRQKKKRAKCKHFTYIQ